MRWMLASSKLILARCKITVSAIHSEGYSITLKHVRKVSYEKGPVIKVSVRVVVR